MCVSFRNEFGSFNYAAVNLILSKAGAGLMEASPVCSECGFLGFYSLTDLWSLLKLLLSLLLSGELPLAGERREWSPLIQIDMLHFITFFKKISL